MTNNIISDESIKLIQALGIPLIPDNRSYWLVRTNGGIYYDDFLFNKYIGIGWNEFSDEKYFKMSQDELKSEVTSVYPDEKFPGNVASQILKFVNEIKKGDIVLFPSKNSKFITFCEVESDEVILLDIENDFESILDEFYDEDEGSTSIVPLIKRKNVKVLKIVKRSELDPYIFPIIHSHHTITEANIYANFIERAINEIYIRQGKIHTIINVKKKRDLHAIKLIDSLNSILSVIDVYNDITSEGLDKNNYDIKLNVQSPGVIELLTEATVFSIKAGAINTLLFGGKFHLKIDKLGIDYLLESKGLAGLVKKIFEERHIHIERINEINDSNKVLTDEQNKKIDDLLKRAIDTRNTLELDDKTNETAN